MSRHIEGGGGQVDKQREGRMARVAPPTTASVTSKTGGECDLPMSSVGEGSTGLFPELCMRIVDKNDEMRSIHVQFYEEKKCTTTSATVRA